MKNLLIKFLRLSNKLNKKYKKMKLGDIYLIISLIATSVFVLNDFFTIIMVIIIGGLRVVYEFDLIDHTDKI